MGRVRINPLHLRVDSRPVVECPKCGAALRWGPVTFPHTRLASHLEAACPGVTGLDAAGSLQLARELLAEQ